MAKSLQQMLEGVVASTRMRQVPHYPVMRSPFYMHVPIPDSWKGKGSLTMVEVESAQEIAAILKKANQEKLPVYVRQATGYVSADITRPERPGAIVIEMKRMRWVRPDFDANYVEVGPAVTEKELNDALSPQGYSYPELIGPVSWGAMVGLNSSGRSVDPYLGKPGDYVLGLEVVLPTGEIIQTGTRSMRRPCGMDLTRLFTGGQAITGVIAGLRLRLVPSPRHQMWATVHMPSVKAVGQAVHNVYRTRAPYARLLEFMSHNYLKEMGFPATPPAMMVVSTDGFTSIEMEAKMEAILDVLKSQGGSNVTWMNADDWAKLYQVREGGPKRLADRGMVLLNGEVLDCPLASLVSCLEEAEQVQQHMEKSYPGVTTYSLGHIGASSFHPSISAPVSWGFPRLGEVVKDFRQRILAIKLKYGATVGEQGIFPEHAQWFVRLNGERHLAILRGIKDYLDPNHILNDIRLPSTGH